MFFRPLASLAALLLIGCASVPKDREAAFFAAVESNGEVRLTGWADVLSAEFMIFPDRAAMEAFYDREARENWPNMTVTADWPRSTKCVSAFFVPWRGHNNRIYNGRRIVVTGTIMDYDAFPDRGGDIMPTTKVSGDRAIENNCFGKKVLVLRSVRPAD